MPDNRYTAQFLLTDQAGLTNFTESVIFTIDTTPPSVSEVAANDTTVFSTQIIRINATVTDTNLNPSTIVASGDSGATNVSMTLLSGGVYRTDTTASALGCAADGECTVTVYAKDAAGNQAQDTTAISVDGTAPLVTITSPSAGNTSSSVTNFNATVLEDNPSTGTVQVTPDGQSPSNYTLTNRSGNWGYTNASMPDNRYTAQFIIDDTLGNTNNTESVTFTVDSTPPSVTPLFPINATTTTQNTVTFNATISDTGTGIRNMTLIIDGIQNQTNTSGISGIYEFTLNISNGMHNWSVIAHDYAGNSNQSETRQISINPLVNTEPQTTQISINSTSAGNYTTGNIECYTTGSDNESSSLTAYYEWYLDGEKHSSGSLGIQRGSHGMIARIMNGNTSKNQVWTCSVLMSDGLLNETEWNNISITIRNSPPSPASPMAFNSTSQSPTFAFGDTVTVKVNVTDSDGSGDLLSALLNITSPTGARLTSESMIMVDAIEGGFTYEYDYVVDEDVMGTWSINIITYDTEGSSAEASTTFRVGIELPPTHSIQINLTLNGTQNTVHIPGTGEFAASSLQAASYTSPPDYYLSSYLNGNLKALVFSERNPVSLSVSSNQTHHTISITQNLSNSRTFLVFTQGDRETVPARIQAIEAGTFLSQVSPSFAYTAGPAPRPKISVGYDKIDIESNLTVRGREIRLIVENIGVIGGKEVVRIEEV